MQEDSHLSSHCIACSPTHQAEEQLLRDFSAATDELTQRIRAALCANPNPNPNPNPNLTLTVTLPLPVTLTLTLTLTPTLTSPAAPRLLLQP